MITDWKSDTTTRAFFFRKFKVLNKASKIVKSEIFYDFHAMILQNDI